MELLGVLEAPVGDGLEAGVDAEVDVMRLLALPDDVEVLDDAALAVAEDLDLGRAPGEPVVVAVLDALDAAPVNVGEADELRGNLARRVEAPGLAGNVDAGQAEILYVLAVGVAELPCDVLVAALGVGELRPELLLGEAYGLGKAPDSARVHEGAVVGDVLAVRPYRPDGDRDGELLAVPVHDEAAVVDDGLGPDGAHVALLPEHRGVIDLPPEEPARDDDEPEDDAAREDAEADYGVPWERPCGLAPLTGAALRRPRPPLGARCGRGAPEAVPPVIAAAPSGIGAGAPSAPPENAGNAVKHA